MFEIDNLVGGFLGGMIFMLFFLLYQKLAKKRAVSQEKQRYLKQQQRLKERWTKENPWD